MAGGHLQEEHEFTCVSEMLRVQDYPSSPRAHDAHTACSHVEPRCVQSSSSEARPRHLCLPIPVPRPPENSLLEPNPTGVQASSSAGLLGPLPGPDGVRQASTPRPDITALALVPESWGRI